MVAWIFVPTEVLHVRCMGTVLRKSIPINFQYDPQSAHLHGFSNGFRRQSGAGVLYKVHSQLSQTYSTSEEKSELQISDLKISPLLKTHTSADYSWISEFFMRACIRSGNLEQISCLPSTDRLFAHSFAHSAMSRTYDRYMYNYYRICYSTPVL